MAALASPRLGGWTRRKGNLLSSGNILKPLSKPSISHLETSKDVASTPMAKSDSNSSSESDANNLSAGTLALEILSGVSISPPQDDARPFEPYLLCNFGEQYSKSNAPKRFVNNDLTTPVWSFKALHEWKAGATLIISIFAHTDTDRPMCFAQIKLPEGMADGVKEPHWLHMRSPSGETLKSSIYVNLTYNKPKKGVKITPDDFEVVKVLGCGSYGTVYKVKKRDTDRCYAMKVLSKSAIMSSRTHSHVLSERKILQDTRTQAASPFLVGLQFSFQTDTHLYFVMDLKNGGELFQYLQREGGRFDEDRVRFYAGEILLAIETLHANNIIYRDLKPENILLDDAGHIALCDFGLAKSLSKGARTKTFCGTSDYIPPEVIDGDEEGYDGRVDFWSLGILIYEMLFGYTPFFSEDRYVKYEKIKTAELKIPNRGISEQARDLLRKLLTRETSQRLGTHGAAEVKEHPFFASIDWKALADRLVTPPLKPTAVVDESPQHTPLIGQETSDSPLASRRTSCELTTSTDSDETQADLWRDFSFSYSSKSSRASSFSSLRGKPKARGLSMTQIDRKLEEVQLKAD